MEGSAVTPSKQRLVRVVTGRGVRATGSKPVIRHAAQQPLASASLSPRPPPACLTYVAPPARLPEAASLLVDAMQPLSSASEAYHDLHLQPPPPFPTSYDEQFTMAATYLASLHPSTVQPYHTSTDANSMPPQPYDSQAASAASSSLFDTNVHNCLAAVHSSTFVPAPSQPYQQEPPVPYSYPLVPLFQPHAAQFVKHETAAERAEVPWQYPPYMPVKPIASHISQPWPTELSTAPQPAPPSAAVSTYTSVNSSAVSLAVHAGMPVEPLSVSPSQYPLTRWESASHCSTDSLTSHQSSLSSTHSPLSPMQPGAAVCSNGDSGQPAGVERYGSYSTPPTVPPLLTPAPQLPPSALVSVFDSSSQPLQLPSYIYPTVRSAISAALQQSAVSTPSETTGTTTSMQVGSDKRRAALLDTERRLKHRVIDANRRRRETLLVERFAQLSGQRDEASSRDRVSTLEVACDRYEELTQLVEVMQAKLRSMESRLQALGGTAMVDGQLHGKRRPADGRRAPARKRVDVQHGRQSKRPDGPLSTSSHITLVDDTCEMVVSDSDSADDN